VRVGGRVVESEGHVRKASMLESSHPSLLGFIGVAFPITITRPTWDHRQQLRPPVSGHMDESSFVIITSPLDYFSRRLDTLLCSDGLRFPYLILRRSHVSKIPLCSFGIGIHFCSHALLLRGPLTHLW
jgi:hypothetical protein